MKEKSAVRRRIALLLLVAIVLTSAVIWLQSVKSVEVSRKQSARITEIVRPVLEKVTGKGSVTDHLVRKLAHFFEFFLLGCELLALSLVRGLTPQKLLNAAFYGLFVGLADETIQILANRGSLVSDVWIDFAGTLCGMLACLLLYLLALLIRKRKRKA